jgi:hypothetical protein
MILDQRKLRKFRQSSFRAGQALNEEGWFWKE